MKDYISQQLNKWMINQMNDLSNEWFIKWMIYQMNELSNEWVIKWMIYQMNDLSNEWLIECKINQMNECLTLNLSTGLVKVFQGISAQLGFQVFKITSMMISGQKNEKVKFFKNNFWLNFARTKLMDLFSKLFHFSFNELLPSHQFLLIDNSNLSVL